MKIAIIGENYYPTVGGIQEHMYNQARCLREEGHDTCIITGMPEVKRWIGPQDSSWVHRVGKSVRYGVMGTVTNYTFGPVTARNLNRLFASRQFDLIHIHNPCDFGLPLLAYWLFKGKKVATLHSAFAHSGGRTVVSPYYRSVLRRTQKIIAVSELAAASMLRYADFEYDIIPNGVNVAAFALGKKQACYDDGRKTVLFLGRFEKRNGLDNLLQAFAAVVRQYPDCRLVVAGAARDGSTDEYEQLVPDSCRKNVEFLGIVENRKRADLYASADVFVLPARFGGSFSIMILEALATGTPVISTPFVGSEHRGKHWETVHICDDYSPNSIGAMIIRVLGSDNSQQVKHGRKIVMEYDWKVVVERLLSVYDHVLST